VIWRSQKVEGLLSQIQAIAIKYEGKEGMSNDSDYARLMPELQSVRAHLEMVIQERDELSDDLTQLAECVDRG
jgi:hypothetical protein